MSARFLVLPEMQGIADNTDDVFNPSECAPGIATVRRGRITKRSGEIVDCVMAVVPDAGLSGLYIAIRDNGKPWHMSTGSSNPDLRIVEAVTHIIGVMPR